MKLISMWKDDITVIKHNGARVRSQSIVDEFLFRLNATGAKYRVVIKHNAYEFQSHLNLERWTNDKGFQVVNESNTYEYDYLNDYTYARPDMVHFSMFEEVIYDSIELAVDFDGEFGTVNELEATGGSVG